MITNQVKPAQDNIKNAIEIQEWLVNYLAEFLEVETSEIEINRSFDEYSLDSSLLKFFVNDSFFLQCCHKETIRNNRLFAALLRPNLIYCR